MDPKAIRGLLNRVQRGEASVEVALEELKVLPFRQLGHSATVDHHRHLRLGFPEVVLGVGKTGEQVAHIMLELASTGANVLATRVDASKAEVVLREVEGVKYEPLPRLLVLEQQPFVDRGRGVMAIVSAGTSDLPVAEEAARVASLFGNRIERVYDVGVAGIHRTLSRIDTLRSAEVLIVVAGMEGALPSVIAGLVERPVIAVPTSVGYGASFGGLAALLGMLSSCASGVTVVNIDNGFGAAYAAALINRRGE
ncbi:MAG: nickel pincer cofactor biosynthesis protein LarB [Deltaproteobacteria bacterium]|nr:nickel pincer cofactor biosynthesis protein LarB [Deltaproteobacteria bacterium]